MGTGFRVHAVGDIGGDVSPDILLGKGIRKMVKVKG